MTSPPSPRTILLQTTIAQDQSDIDMLWLHEGAISAPADENARVVADA